ncbi:MAG: family 43 glycosylhydrolase, partial [Lentisphaerae bacterium]|nr:family 43 glycosylhydrolase [Lentisphaerota bacterium]
AYPTGGGTSEPGFCAWSSPDLREWKPEGMILKLADVSWANGDPWAPDIIQRNGLFYFYFCSGSAIGVAVSDNPVGPFHDALCKPLIPYEEDMSSIDPKAFIDDDGQAYLYWGATFDGRLFMRKLNSDMISFSGEKKTIYEFDAHAYYHCEGAFIFKRAGLYYFMWSEYNWTTLPNLEEDNSYRVNFAIASSPEGPFKRVESRVPILSTDMARKIIGPGHNSVFQISGTDTFIIAYHYHHGDEIRFAALDTLQFGSDGLLWTLNPSETGVPPVPLSCGLTLDGTGPFTHEDAISFKAAYPSVAHKLRLVVNGEIVMEGSPSPLLNWNNASSGFKRVKLEAVNGSGSVAVSVPLDIDINN